MDSRYRHRFRRRGHERRGRARPARSATQEAAARGVRGLSQLERRGQLHCEHSAGAAPGDLSNSTTRCGPLGLRPEQSPPWASTKWRPRRSRWSTSGSLGEHVGRGVSRGFFVVAEIHGAADSIAARLFGEVERFVGALNEGVEARVLVGNHRGDADTRGHL